MSANELHFLPDICHMLRIPNLAVSGGWGERIHVHRGIRGIEGGGVAGDHCYRGRRSLCRLRCGRLYSMGVRDIGHFRVASLDVEGGYVHRKKTLKRQITCTLMLASVEGGQTITDLVLPALNRRAFATLLHGERL